MTRANEKSPYAGGTSREWRVLQEKAQRKTRITGYVGDKVMEVSTYAMQPTRTLRIVNSDK
jgi:hypothetical protein